MDCHRESEVLDGAMVNDILYSKTLCTFPAGAGEI